MALLATSGQCGPQPACMVPRNTLNDPFLDLTPQQCVTNVVPNRHYSGSYIPSKRLKPIRLLMNRKFNWKTSSRFLHFLKIRGYYLMSSKLILDLFIVLPVSWTKPFITFLVIVLSIEMIQIFRNKMKSPIRKNWWIEVLCGTLHQDSRSWFMFLLSPGSNYLTRKGFRTAIFKPSKIWKKRIDSDLVFEKPYFKATKLISQNSRFDNRQKKEKFSLLKATFIVSQTLWIWS